MSNGPAIQYATTSDGKSIAFAVYGSGKPLIWVPALFSHIHLQWRFQPDWYAGLTARTDDVTLIVAKIL